MSFFKSLVRHTVGIYCELAIKRDPYDRPVEAKVISRRQEPRVDMRGRMLPGCREVITVQGNVRTINRFTDGTTPQGDVSEVHTHIAPYLWEISHESWDIDE